MVGAAVWVEARVDPIAEVAVLPNGNVEGGTDASFVIMWAGEGLGEESVSLQTCCIYPTTKGRNHVVAWFIVVVAEELRLEEWVLVI